MPLPSPVLDDRSYQQLRDELVRRIPVYTPEWTDHNASDPGITLIELFAFLGESLLFRFNQIPETTKHAFLELLQIPLRPAQPASALVALKRTDSGSAGITVAKDSEARAGSLSFETTVEATVHALEARAYARIATSAPGDGDVKDYTQATLDALGIAESGAAFYQTTEVPPDPEAPDAAPVDLSKAVDRALWIAVLSTDSTDVNALKGATLNIGFVPDEWDVTMGDVKPCPGECACGGEIDTATEEDDLLWHASMPDPHVNGAPAYRTLTPVSNSTGGFARAGVVRIELPSDATWPLGVPKLPSPQLAGTGDYPPLVPDDEVTGNLLFWLRATRRSANAAQLPKVLFVGINVTEVVHARTAPLEFLGIGTGDADQRVRLIHSSVLAGSAQIQVEESGKWKTWTHVDDFDASHPDSRHFTLDLEAGEVYFGNGERGRAPQIGERIRAKSYRCGGGTAGNVAAKAISKLPSFSALKASNPLAAHGGADAESLEAGLDRVPGELRRRDRAVTADDFRELALLTPGTDLRRADCLARFHPPTRASEVPGVVTVVVWPREDRKHPSAPTPDRDTLDEVCAWLDSRRLITTELYVIPPTYRKVAVSVGIKAKKGYGIDALRKWVELVLRQYLAPLPPYGPDGNGWPLGRPVYGPELEAAALQVEGIEYLEGLETAWMDATRAWVPSNGKPVVLERWEVPELAEITVVQGPPLDPGVALVPEPAANPVPVPKPSKEC